MSHFRRTADLALLGAALPRAALLGAALLGAALLVGVALALLTWLLARSGPEGGAGASWSLRGNGALIVPFGLGPALLAGLWSALVLHARAAERWRLLSGIMALIGVLIPLAGLLALSAFGTSSAGQVAASSLFMGALLWMPLAAVLSAVLPVGRRLAAEFGRMEHVSLGSGMTLLLVAGFVVATRVLPPGS